MTCEIKVTKDIESDLMMKAQFGVQAFKAHLGITLILKAIYFSPMSVEISFQRSHQRVS